MTGKITKCVSILLLASFLALVFLFALGLTQLTPSARAAYEPPPKYTYSTASQIGTMTDYLYWSRNDSEDYMDDLDDIKKIEEDYISKGNIKPVIDVESNVHGNLNNRQNEIEVVGLAINSDGDLAPKLHISKPASDVTIDETLYKKNTMVQLDIKIDGRAAGPLDYPIAIIMPIPTGVSPENFVILHELQYGGFEIIVPRILSDGKCMFVVTSFSTFVFVNTNANISSTAVAAAAAQKEQNRAAPVVPVLYDVTKSGETFTFKTIIANAANNMSGATVSVMLNEKYTASVTIGQDGVGIGTLEAAGFTGDIANFSARVHGQGAFSVTYPMVVYSTGEVARR